MTEKGMHKSREAIIKISQNAKTNPNYGMRGKHHSEESRRKMSESFKGRTPWNKGKTGVYSEKTKEQMGYWKGKHRAEEAKRKASESLLGRKRKPFSEEWKNNIRKGSLGKVLSEEHKRKIRESTKGINKGNKHSEKTKQIIREKRKIQQNTYTTSIERRIQSFLSKLHIEYLAHKYISEISHAYQCDILIPVQEGIIQKTVIECDGDYWHSLPNRRVLDEIRTKELFESGFRVIRLGESEIQVMRLSGFQTKLIAEAGG